MNGILIIDKPSGWTSQDVCSKLRGLFHERRIGHGGTLDPMATGVLPVFLGRATRAASYSENSSKTYEAGVRLGLVTDTQDITGSIMSSCAAQVSPEELAAVLSRFTGPQRQVPPMYSAVKIGGKKLYDLARKGVTVERKSREITVHSLELIGSQGGDYVIRVRCSKGTYIRTLLNGIGQAPGCGACMAPLRRTQAAGYTLADSVSLLTLMEEDEDRRRGHVLPLDSMFRMHPSVTVSGRALTLAKCGSPFPCSPELSGPVRVYDEGGNFLLLGSCADGVCTTVKNFFEV